VIRMKVTSVPGPVIRLPDTVSWRVRAGNMGISRHAAWYTAFSISSKDCAMKRLVAAAAALATLATTGCAGISVTQLWRDPDFVSRPGTRVSMDNSANPAQFENAMAQALRARGFETTTNLGNFPPGRINRMAIRQYVAENQVDLILMTRLTTEPATPVVVTKTAVVSSGWPGNFSTVAGSQTMVIQGTNVNARVEAFDARTEPNALVWSGQSNTVDMKTAPQSLATTVAADLVAARILVR
jgi:hypothetical protein